MKDNPPEAIKYDRGKVRFDLIPTEALAKIAWVFTVGAQKYEPHNWAKGMDWSRIYSALQRHLHAFWGGQEKDPETGLFHLAQAAWGCMVLLEYLRLHPELDDRQERVMKRWQDDVSSQTQPE